MTMQYLYHINKDLSHVILRYLDDHAHTKGHDSGHDCDGMAQYQMGAGRDQTFFYTLDGFSHHGEDLHNIYVRSNTKPGL